jgi:hypothetical protein
MTTNYTLECWFKLNALPSNAGNTTMGVISKYQNSADSGYILRIDYDDILSFDGSRALSQTVETGVWYHVAAVNDAGTRHLYIDGTEVVLTGTPITIQSNTSWLGIGVDYKADNLRYFDGQIDEVRIWNDVRSEEEIRQNMYRQLPNPSDASLVAYYQLNGSTDDASSNSYDGNYVGGTASYHTSPAMFGPKNLLDFDGNDDYVNIPDLKISGSAVTLETWVYLREFGDPALDANIANLLRGGDENIVLRIGDGGMPNNMPQFVVRLVEFSTG